MFKRLFMILLYSAVIFSYHSLDNKTEIEEIKLVEQNQTFSNSNSNYKPNKVENKQENELTPAEQNAYIQEMENLLNETDGGDMIIKDAENEGTDFKEIIFSDDFDLIEEEY